MPAIVGPGGGAGDGATAACRTGLPLNLLGSVTTGAGAAATGLAADKLRTFARSSAFSFSILSSRAITSSSVADRAAPPNETRQRAAQAVPERSLFLMAFSPPSQPDSTYGRKQRNVYQMPIGRPGPPVNERFIICRKNGTVILLQCSNLSHQSCHFDAAVGCAAYFM